MNDTYLISIEDGKKQEPWDYGTVGQNLGDKPECYSISVLDTEQQFILFKKRKMVCIYSI